MPNRTEEQLQATLPPPPTKLKPIPNADKADFFGEMAWSPVGTDGAIRITNGWDKQNVTTVVIPQLQRMAAITVSCGFPLSGRVPWHIKYTDNLLGFFKDIDDAGKLPLVLTWAGSWVPRRVRGGQALSSHAYASAFDINAAWNMLGKPPATAGKKGTVVELLEAAVNNHFWWGGWGWGPGTRLDGMHFEIGKHDIIRE